MNHTPIKDDDINFLLNISREVTEELINKYANVYLLLLNLPNGTLVITGNAGMFFKELKENPQAKIEEMKKNHIVFKN